MVRAACEKLAMERADYRFSRRDVREHTGWGNTQLKVHLARLAELEYVLVHRGRQGQGYVYELAYDGQGRDGTPFLPGLLDETADASRADGETSRRADAHVTEAGRPPDGPEPDGGRSADSPVKPEVSGGNANTATTIADRSRTGATQTTPSHVTAEATG
jgi:hypothetical protein